MNPSCPICQMEMIFISDRYVRNGNTMYYTVRCKNKYCSCKGYNQATIMEIDELKILERYSFYFIISESPLEGWRVVGSRGANETQLYELVETNGAGGQVTITGGCANPSGTGGNVILTGGSGTHLTSFGGPISIVAGSSSPSYGATSNIADPIVSVPFINLSLDPDKFHIEANHLLQRLKKLIIFS